jgi:hypothetical protein
MQASYEGIPMAKYFFKKDDQYVLNRCTKFLSRYNTDARHSCGAPGEESPRDRIAEAWRFPIIDTYGGGADAVNDPAQLGSFDERGNKVRQARNVELHPTALALLEPIRGWQRQVAIRAEAVI